MAIALLIKPSVAFAASSSITVSADKTEAEPGDVINYSIILGPVDDMGTMQMMLVIPEGLSFVSGSGKLADGLKSTLGYDTVDFVERTKIINGYGSGDDYSSDGNTLICTFQCKVEEGFSGTAEIGLTELEFYSCQTWEDHTEDYKVNNAVVRVVAEPSPSDDPTPSGDTTHDEPTPSGSTTPDEPTQSGSTTPGEPTPSGGTKPDEPTPSGSTTPDEPTQSGDTTPDEPTPSGGSTPDEPTPSGGTTPDEPTPSGGSTPDEPAPSGSTTPDEQMPSGGSNQTPSGENGQNTSDPSAPETDVPGSDSKEEPEDKKNSSEDPDNGPQSSFPWWVILITVLAVVLLLILVLKKQKETAKKPSIYRKK